MSARLTVGRDNQLKENTESVFPRQAPAIRIAAKIFSYVFHPIFIPVYVAWFLIYIQPYLFTGFSEWNRTRTMIQFLMMYSFFPLVTTLLLKAVGFIDSIFLKTQRDRVIPYAVCMIYYFWVWYVLYKQPEYPSAIVQFSLAIFIASIFGLMSNISMKISMHTMAAGIMVTFIISLAFRQDISFGLYVSIAVLITGLIASSRFIVSDHTSREIYGGLLAGIGAQLLANWLG